MLFHGILLVDKPSGMTSHDVVARARRILQTKAVGHCGTLDPLASGLMVLLINEATKLSQYILEKDKAYRVRAQLGLTTDTLDVTGTRLTESLEIPQQEKVREAALALQGSLLLPVPIYSAVKIDGKKLYDYARDGEKIETPMREMKFEKVTLGAQGNDFIEADISCSKGSYIRAWVHELGRVLGCGAAMSALRRTKSVPYSLEQAVTLEALEESWGKKPLPEGCLIPMEAAIPEAKVVRVKDQTEVMLGNGLISHDLRSQLIMTFHPENDTVIKVLSLKSGRLLALVGLDPGKGFAIRRVFREERE